MFGQAPQTEFDLRFSIARIPVRVHPVFWLTSLYLAWSPHNPELVISRVLCIFLAILVHELGHALVTQGFGWDSEIVLYFMGGYATSTHHSTWRNIAVSAAGPAFGFTLFFTIWFWGRMTGVLSDETTLMHPVFDAGAMLNWPEWLQRGTRGNDVLIDAIAYSLFINFAWNVLNLVPVLPLDGGQISRELCSWFNRAKGPEICAGISLVVAGGIAILALRARMNDEGFLGLEPTFLGLMFGYLAYQSYLQLEAARRGYW